MRAPIKSCFGNFANCHHGWCNGHVITSFVKVSIVIFNEISHSKEKVKSKVLYNTIIIFRNNVNNKGNNAFERYGIVIDVSKK